ncbi:M23 family metallopeptidase [Psychroflexus sp. CAK8W]|uniref:M23 family metallopeptidase n=1 Tax=Psychroflexus longus TaxID=2873596 RepID=A0ABS7XGD9_9FLAO|nr:M23 family metallopeptidase [Psychroflexus longus]MBZ9777995.1 M23 family metallopeptidase [Psychroflexus longus]
MKTKLIQLFLVLFCLALSLNCEKEDQFIRSEESIKTVSLDQALDIMKQTQQDILAKSNANFITSISEEVNYEDLTNTDEELAVIPVTTQYSKLNSRLVLLTIDGKVQSAVVSLNPFENSTPSSFSGELLITAMEGTFQKAFRIEENVFVSEYVNNNSKSKESNKLENHNTPKDTRGSCRCVFSVCDYCQLEEVVIVVESTPPRIPTPYISITHMYNTDGSGGKTSANEWDLGGSGSGYTDNTPEPDPEVDKPCPGDPVPNPEIAPQKGVSGFEGGRYGCTRTGGVCDNSQEGKDHGGTDVLNDYGEPVYAMFDGVATAVQKYFAKGAGWISYQTATVNGQQISIQYFHLQENNRVSGSISAGDIIGYQGDSGNLAGAIAKGSVVSHVHVKIKDANSNTLDPEDFFGTNPTSSTNSNCN